MSRCTKCNQVVYSAEALTANNILYHKRCFRCTTCAAPLTVSNYKSTFNEIYCRVHNPAPAYSGVTWISGANKASSDGTHF